MIFVELVGWWAVAVGVWMASLSAWSGQDLIVAAGCAVPCALAAAGGRRAIGGAWRAPRPALGWFALLPVAIVVDAARVLIWPLRSRDGGSFKTLAIGARGRTAAAHGRQAAASLALSSTPGSYVVGADATAGTLTVHGLGGSSRLERLVAE